MVKTKDKVYDAAENVKPYVERAMNDDKLREDVMSAFATAKDLYTELVGPRGAVTLATRVATDDEIREKLKAAVDDLRSAADRLQGKKVAQRTQHDVADRRHRARHPLQPGHRARDAQWVKDMIGGGEDEFGGDYPSSNGSPQPRARAG